MEKRNEHPLQNTLLMLEDIKNFLQNNSLGELHLSNLPQFFWEELGECIGDIKNYIKENNQDI